MFQFSSKYSGSISFSSGRRKKKKKTSKWKYSKWDLMCWHGEEGRGGLLSDQMEQSAFLECLVRSLSGARIWMEPSVPYWLKTLTSRVLSMWSGLPADKAGPHKLRGLGMRRWRLRGGHNWEAAFTQLHHCVLSYRSLGAAHTWVSASLWQRPARCCGQDEWLITNRDERLAMMNTDD